MYHSCIFNTLLIILNPQAMITAIYGQNVSHNYVNYGLHVVSDTLRYKFFLWINLDYTL